MVVPYVIINDIIPVLCYAINYSTFYYVIQLGETFSSTEYQQQCFSRHS